MRDPGSKIPDRETEDDAARELRVGEVDSTARIDGVQDALVQPVALLVRHTGGSVPEADEGESHKSVLTPVLKEEIAKRAEMLIDLLTPEPSPGMEKYFGRLLLLDELKQALHTAEIVGDKVDSLPCNGGWLLTTGKETMP